MSAGAEPFGDRTFLAELREMDGQVSVPRARRVGLLTEIEADLEELTRHLVSEGATPEEARQRAIAALVPDDAVLQQLSYLHATPWARATRRLSPRRLRWIERGALTAVTGAVIAGQLTVVGGIEPLRHASAFLWPISLLGVLLTVSVAITGFQLWVRGDDEAGAVWTRRVGTQVLIIGVVGVLAGALDLYLILGQLEAAPGEVLALLLVAVSRVATVVAFALILTLGGAMAWFVAHQRIVVIEARYRQSLGMAEPLSHVRETS